VKNIDRKAEILGAAARLFKEKGYGAVSMRDLAAALNIKASSLYNHINSKQEILQAIIMPLAYEFTAGMEKIKAANLTPRQQLNHIIEQHVEISIHHPEAIASLNNEWMNLEGDSLKQFIAMRTNYEAHLKEILQQGIAYGAFKPLDVELTIFAILSTLRTLHLWYKRKKSLRGDALKTELKSLLLQGIVNQS